MDPLLNPIFEAATKSLANTLGEIVKGAGLKLVHHQEIQSATRRYAERYLERHGMIKTIGMDRPIPLHKVYTAAASINPSEVRKFRNTYNLQAAFIENSRRNLQDPSGMTNKTPAIEHANEHRFLNVLGAPGAGKSTFLKHIGLQALLPGSVRAKLAASVGLRPSSPKTLSDHDTEYAHDNFPVFVELRKIKDLQTAGRFEILIQDELSTLGINLEDAELTKLLDSGRFLFLFDGLDEVGLAQLARTLDGLRDFVDKYSLNRFVTSCRTAFYKHYLPRFTDIIIADFDGPQIANFVKNWFAGTPSGADTASRFLAKLETSESTRELAGTPLLLTFLCLAYDERQTLPANRSALYRQALSILLERWAAHKRVHNEPIYAELDSEIEIQMLSEIAGPAFQQNQYFFREDELTEQISRFCTDHLKAPKKLSGRQILDAIEVQQGLLVQRAHDVYSFSHLTIQEYLTVTWLVTRGQVDACVRDRLSDRRWREVLLLLAGGVATPDQYLQSLASGAGTLVRDPQLTVLMRWVAVHCSQRAVVDLSLPTRRAEALQIILDLDAAALLGESATGPVMQQAGSADDLYLRILATDRDLDPDLARMQAQAEFENIPQARLRNIADIENALVSISNELVRDLDVAMPVTMQPISPNTKALGPPWELPGIKQPKINEHIAKCGLLMVELSGCLDRPDRAELALCELRKWYTSRSGLDHTSAIRQTMDVIATALGITEDCFRLPLSSLQQLEFYLSAYQLVLDARHCATSIRKMAWVRIMSEFLGPP